MRKPPILAVVTLAIGIGAATAIFSMVDAVLLRSLPYQEPGRLFRVWQAFPEWQRQATLRDRWNRVGVSYPQFLALQEQKTLVAHAGIYALAEASLTGLAGAEQITLARSSASLLPTLGVHPAYGRTFTADDEERGAALVMLGYDLWRRQFGSEAAIVGRTVSIDGTPHDVIGVAPPELRLFGQMMGREGPSMSPDAWTVIGRHTRQAADSQGHIYNAVVRLRPGVDARAGEGPLVAAMRRSYETYRKGAKSLPGGSLESLGQFETTAARTPLWIMLAAAGVVLFVACGNVGNLMLSSLVPRTRELAVRGALGASRWRVIRTLLGESLTLSGAAGVLAGGIAWGIVKVLVALAPPGTPNIDTVTLDLPVLLFALGLTALTAVFFGLLPAWFASGGSIVGGLRESRPTMSRAGGRAQRIVCATQVAMAVVVLASAVLLARSLMRLTSIDPGFRSQGMLTFEVGLPGARSAGLPQYRAFYDDLRTRLAAVPGVREVTQTSSLPFRRGAFASNSLIVEGRPADKERPLEVERRIVVPNYFEVLGIRAIEGRTPATVANGGCEMAVSRTAARLIWPAGGAIGSRVKSQGYTCTLVGIVSDTRERGLGAEPLPTFYLPDSAGDYGNATLIVRATVPPDSLIPAVRRLVRDLDPNLPITHLMPFDAVVEQSLVTERYRAFPMSLFAIVTVLLAAVGTYGVISQIVAHELRALGIRIALGAMPAQIMARVLRQTAVLAAAGLASGVALALAVSRFLRAYLFGIEPTSVSTYAGVALTVAALTLLAGWIPARRAARIDPVAVLRADA